MKFLLSVLLLLGASLGTRAQLTVAEGGELTLSSATSSVYATNITVQDGGSMVLATQGSYAYGDDVTVEDGGRLVIRGFVAWDNSITLRGTTVFQLSDVPSTFQYGQTDGPGTAIVQGTVRTELIDGFAPPADEILEYDLVAAGNLGGPIGTAETPSPDWNYALSNNFLRVIYDAGALPVEWLDFSGSWLGKNTRLDWQTARETASSHYEIERRNPAGEWDNIGRVAAVGEATTTSTYDFLDTDPGPTNPIYYRLRQVDLTGEANYSDVISLRRDDLDGEAFLFPNPAHDHIYVTGFPAGPFRVNDATGRTIARGRIGDGERFRVELPKTLPAGTYLLRSETGVVKRFVVASN